jgi:hypothetical protein
VRYTYNSAAVGSSLLLVSFKSGMQLSRPFVISDIALLNFILEVLSRKREIQFRVVYQGVPVCVQLQSFAESVKRLASL